MKFTPTLLSLCSYILKKNFFKLCYPFYLKILKIIKNAKLKNREKVLVGKTNCENMSPQKFL